MVKIVNQAECNGTPLTNHQIDVLGITVAIVMSVPLLNVIYSIGAICKWIFDPHKLKDEIDDLIDRIRRSIP
jgi:hypothetical protein